MAQGLPAGVTPGQIYRHDRFYRSEAGEWKRKYLLVLASTPGGDVIYRLLTSRAHGRPTTPPCSHADPYPSFYLGHLGDPLTGNSWLDLRECEDYEGQAFVQEMRGGDLHPVATLPVKQLCPALDCTASADDTTRQQERCIRNARAALNCP